MHSTRYPLPTQGIPSTFNTEILNTHFFSYLHLKILFPPLLHITVQQLCALSAGEGKGLATVAVSTLINNSLLKINLEPLSSSSSGPQVWAWAFLFCSGENEGDYWEEEAPKCASVLPSKKPGVFPHFLPIFYPFWAYSEGTRREILKGSPFPVILCPHRRIIPLTTPCSPVLHPRNKGGENREGEKCN